MKPEIRRILNEKFNQLEGKVEEPKKLELTPEMTDLITKVIAATQKLNPLDERKYNEEINREKRRAMFAVELAKAEEQTRLNRINGCSHSRDSRLGNAVAKGTGEWTTGGQMHGNDTATLTCLRCGFGWHFSTTPQEREYFREQGMLGMAPPPMDRLVAA